jgi:hypothetical protein
LLFGLTIASTALAQQPSFDFASDSINIDSTTAQIPVMCAVDPQKKNPGSK